MVNNHRTASRVIASMLAVIMVVAFAFAPVKASAETAELVMSQDGMDITVKSVIDTETNMLALMGSLGVEGEVMADAALYAGAAGLAVACNPFLDQVYGIDIMNYQENLKNSIFAPDSGSQFALDQQTFDTLMAGPQVTVNAPEMSQETVETLAMAVMKYVGIVAEDMSNGMEMRMASETLYVGSQAIDTNVVTIEIDSADLSKVTTDVLAAVSEDTDLVAVMGEVIDAGIASGQVTVPEELEGVTGAQLMDALIQQVPELTEQVNAFFTENEMAMSVTANMSKDTNSVVRVALALTIDGDTLTVRCTTGESLATSEVISLEVLADEEVILEIAHRITENTDKAYASVFTVTEGGTEDLKIAFNWNKVTGSYALGMTQYDETTTLTGTLTVGDDSMSITFDAINGESLGYICLTVNGENGIEMPAYADVLTMSEEEFVAMVQSIMSTVNSLTGSAE